MRLSSCITIGFLFFRLIPMYAEADTIYSSIHADSLLALFQFDNAARYYQSSAEYYHANNEWLNCVSAYRKAGDVCRVNAKLKEAQNYYLKALSFIETNFSNTGKPESLEKTDVLINLGDLRIRQSEYPKAYDHLIEAQALLKRTDSLDLKRRARLLNKLGKYYLQTDRYTEATESFQDALSLYHQLGDSTSGDLIETYFNQVWLFKITGALSEALDCLGKISGILNDLPLPDLPGTSQYFHYMGIIHENRWELSEALAYFEKGVTLTKEIYGENHPYVESYYNNMAIVYGKSGNYEVSQQYNFNSLRSTIELYGEEHPDVARGYNNIGLVYSLMGNFDLALEYYLKSLRIKIKAFGNYHQEVALACNNIANVCLEKEDYKMAGQYIGMALKININCFTEKHQEVANNYGTMSKIYLKQGVYDQALLCIEKSLEIRKSIFGDLHQDIADCYIRRGNIFFEQGILDEAINDLLCGQEIYKELYGEKHPGLAEDYLIIAKIFSTKKEYSAALAYCQKAIISNTNQFNDTNVYSNSPDSASILIPLLLKTLRTKAYTFYLRFKQNGSKQDIIASLDAYEQFFRIVKKVRSEYRIENSRLLLSQNTKEYYLQALEVAFEYAKMFPGRENTERLFTIIEEAKATTLALHVLDNEAILYSGIPDTLHRAVKDLANKLNFLNSEIEKELLKKAGYDTLRLIQYQNLRFTNTLRYDSLITSLEKCYPTYYELKHMYETVRSSQVIDLLDDTTALIDYLVGDSALFIAVIDDTALHVERVSINNSFEDTVYDYFYSLKKAETELFSEKSRKLYSSLIYPAMNYLNAKKKLIIIADEYLSYLPFETLVSGTSVASGFDFSKEDYLIRSYALSYNQSATLWYTKMKEYQPKSTGSESFIGFAPVFDQTSDSDLIVSVNKSTIDSVNLNYRSIDNSINGFKPLPYSKEEVISIVNLFNRKAMKATAYLYNAASEANFTNYAAGYTYVHVSSHGFTNDKTPDLSGIAFSKPVETGDSVLDERNDGILYLSEIYNLTLNADLLVLSSCEGGTGKLSRGEGILSMTRGFLHTGTSNIVYSLWNVLDKSTKYLMISFYEFLLNGESYSEALRHAKLTMINNPDTSFPYFWSGFVLTGL